MTTTNINFVSEEEAFAEIRPDVRLLMDQSEHSMHCSMIELIGTLPPEAAELLHTFIVSLSARLTRAQAGLYESLSIMSGIGQNIRDAEAEQVARAEADAAANLEEENFKPSNPPKFEKGDAR
jgi:hypothetical protein